MIGRIGAVVLAVWLGAPAAEAASYASEGKCAGLPRIALKVPPGWCLGLVADASSGLVFPRRVIEVAPGEDRNRTVLVLVRETGLTGAATIR